MRGERGILEKRLCTHRLCFVQGPILTGAQLDPLRVFLVRSGMLLQVVLSSETLVAQWTGVWPLASVYSLVSCELLIASESLLAIWLVAFKGSFAGVNPNMAPELACVAERHPTVGTLVPFGSRLL